MRAASLAFFLFLAVPASAAPGTGKQVRLASARPVLDGLAARHRRGEDVRRDLIVALDKLLPRGFYGLKSPDGTGLTLQHESSKEPGRDGWLHLHAAVTDSFHRNWLFGGGYYAKEAKFNLIDGGHYGPHSKLTRFEWDGQRLRLRLTRDKIGQFYDRGPAHQMLELAFDAAGTISTFQVSTRGAWWSPFGRQSLRAVVPKQVIAQDPVFLADDPSGGKTSYAR